MIVRAQFANKDRRSGQPASAAGRLASRTRRLLDFFMEATALLYCMTLEDWK